MSVPSASAATPGKASAANTETTMRGRWLVIARVGWVALTLLVLALNAIAIPQADALLQAVCQPDAPCS